MQHKFETTHNEKVFALEEALRVAEAKLDAVTTEYHDHTTKTMESSAQMETTIKELSATATAQLLEHYKEKVDKLEQEKSELLEQLNAART